MIKNTHFIYNQLYTNLQPKSLLVLCELESVTNGQIALCEIIFTIFDTSYIYPLLEVTA